MKEKIFSIADIAQFININYVQANSLLQIAKKENKTIDLIRGGVKILGEHQVSVYGDTLIINVEETQLHIFVKKYIGRKPKSK